jgi:hypothetical protein
MATTAALGLGPLAFKNGPSCPYPNLAYRPGSITMFMEGFPCAFTEPESRLVTNLIIDAYNEASGICDDVFQREMINSSLVEQIYHFSLNDVSDVLETMAQATVAAGAAGQASSLPWSAVSVKRQSCRPLPWQPSPRLPWPRPTAALGLGPLAFKNGPSCP